MASVIVIDDDALLRDALAATLMSVGHEVRVAVSGIGGLREFDQLPADLVVTDVMMDDGDGIELLRALRQKNPCPRIIVISGYADRDSVDFLSLAQKLGASTVLSKPFKEADFLRAVEQCLESH